MVKSFRGKDVDMVELANRFGSNIAIGNVHMNGRGDLIGRDGKILKTREEQIEEYMATHKVQFGEASIKKTEDENEGMAEFQQPKQSLKKTNEKKKVEKEPAPEVVFDEE